MRIGAQFPQTESGTDPAAIREYILAVEELGYTYLLTYDHVIGANIETPERRSGRWPYNIHSTFHEPFVLFGYATALAPRLGLVPGVIILPQRQTVLVAKQAAALDVLSGGHVRLGVGIGWNPVEYEALNENFQNRAARYAEQIALMRTLWTQPEVTFHGKWHHVVQAGLNPLPIQRPIPIWMGGSAEPALKRIGKLADGWILVGPPGPDTEAQWRRIQEYAREAGRDPSAIQLEGGIRLRGDNPDEWRQQKETWQRLGAAYASVNTMGAGFKSLDEHVRALRRFKDEVGL